MAIGNVIAVSLELFGDGSTTSFSFDLLSDVYTISSGVQNWLAGKHPTLPTSVIPTGIISSGTISGSVVSLTLSTAPSGFFGVTVQLVF